MMINHRPYLDIKKVEDHYSKKDGVPVKYVCTSALGGEGYAGDIFYRDTPHPEFGNRYFRLFCNYSHGDVRPTIKIHNADAIEDVEFSMVKGTKGWEYSQHRHDFHKVTGVSVCLDGGRAYCKLSGDINVDVFTFVIRDGEFKPLTTPAFPFR